MCFEQTSSQQGSTATSNSYDPAISSAGTSLAQNAVNTATGTPYQGYTGPTEASFGSGFNTAQDAATAQLAAGNSAYTTGQSALTSGLGALGQTANASVASLMNPNVQATLNPTIQAIQTQANQANQSTAQGATAAGAFGDTGYGAQKALNNYNTQQNIGNATASAYSNAYNTALSTQQAAQNSLLSGATAASNLGSQSSASQTNLESLLGQLGATQQAAGQTGINTAINVNNSNQLGQLTQDQLAASTLSAIPKDTSGTGSTQSTTTTPNNTGIGLLGSLLGGL